MYSWLGGPFSQPLLYLWAVASTRWDHCPPCSLVLQGDTKVAKLSGLRFEVHWLQLHGFIELGCDRNYVKLPSALVRTPLTRIMLHVSFQVNPRH